MSDFDLTIQSSLAAIQSSLNEIIRLLTIIVEKGKPNG